MPSTYRLLGRLETGELAELYRADRDGGPVVVKLFHQRTSDAGYARDLAETARRLQEVPHPGIAHVLELGLVDGRLAVVREDPGRFNLGLALQRLNTKEVLLVPALAMVWVIELLEVVERAHQAGVIHGALTPGNVMLSHEGRPAVCDFGALKALEASPALRKSFGARGRSSYRAPEISRSEEATVQSDLYSLGAITYELLTLREAAIGGPAMSTRRDALPPPSRLNRRLNSRIDPIVLRAIDPNPGRRFKTCREYSSALREFLATNGGLPSKDDLKRFVDELFPKEVNLDNLGPVPFEKSFKLKEVSGADLPVLDEKSMVFMKRSSFSGGEVDSTAETSEAMPVFPEFKAGEPSDLPGEGGEGDENTDPESKPIKRASSNWDAPASVEPVAQRRKDVSSVNPALKRRMKVIEDFADLPGPKDAPNEPSPMDTIPFSTQQALRTEVEVKVTPAPEPEVLHKMEKAGSDTIPEKAIKRVITEEARLAEYKKKKGQMIALAGTIALVGIVMLLVMVWAKGQGLIGKPAPLLEPGRSTTERPRPRPVPTPAPVPKPAPVQPPPPEPTADCYEAPRRGLGFLTVASEKVIRVELDGQRICGSLVKIPVSAGRAHEVKAIDVRTKEQQTQTVTVKLGKTQKLEVFLRRN